MQTTRRQIVGNATPFIARDSPRKLASDFFAVRRRAGLVAPRNHGGAANGGESTVAAPAVVAVERERRASGRDELAWSGPNSDRCGPSTRARGNGRLSPSSGVRQPAPRQPDRRDPPVGFAVFWAKTQRQCSALQISPIVGGFLCPASNVVPICYPSPKCGGFG